MACCGTGKSSPMSMYVLMLSTASKNHDILEDKYFLILVEDSKVNGPHKCTAK